MCSAVRPCRGCSRPGRPGLCWGWKLAGSHGVLSETGRGLCIQIREKRPPVIPGVGPGLRTPAWQGRVKNVFMEELVEEHKWMLK